MKTRRKQMFIGATVLAAASTAGWAGATSHSLHIYYALGVLALAAATARMKVKLPGIDGNMSVNLPFLLAAVLNLSAAEAVAIAAASAVVQCWPQRGAKLKTERMVFNLSTMVFASGLAGLLLTSPWLRSAPEALSIAVAAGTLFLGQTLPVAAILALTEAGSLGTVWCSLANLSFPYYVIGAGMSAMMQSANHQLGWAATLVAFPVMYGIHRSYVTYFKHAVELVAAAPLSRAVGAGA